MQRLAGEVVVDTNVIVKFFVPEPDSEKAIALLQACSAERLHLVALDFFFMEFINALWAKSRRRQLTREQAEIAIQRVEELASVLEVVRSEELLSESFAVACEYAHPVYDIAFLVLARKRGAPLVTADEKFHNKIHPHYPAALLLKDLKT